MTDEEVIAKFRRMAEPMLRESQITAILDRVWNLEKESDISEMIMTLVV
jgi:hypothetical protein